MRGSGRPTQPACLRDPARRLRPRLRSAGAPSGLGAWLLLLLLLATAGATQAREARAARAWLEGTVVHVYDGDSFRLRTADGRVLGVRLAGIDAPERTQPWAGVSRRALQNAIDRRHIRLSVIKTDVYDRLVAFVFLAGADIGLQQVEDGLAWHFSRYDADLEPAERHRYATAQADAQARRAGLWQQHEPLAPWIFRQRQRR